ncbi:MAG: right-handed parallel beta-helix repeat-containing protein, partial [Parvularculaceae bacterium]
GTILVQGGDYRENLVLKKSVSIRGVSDAYDRPVRIFPSADAPCVEVDPGSAAAAVTLSKLVFKFDNVRYGSACVEVQSGSFAMRDSFVIPADADIPLRAAYGKLMPELYDHIAGPSRDNPNTPTFLSKLERYAARHNQPVGADNPAWRDISGGTNVETLVHLKGNQGGPLDGPIAGIHVAAGDVRLEGNVIIGTQVGVEFASADAAMVRGSLTNNVILGNGVGIGISGVAADLLVTRNTVRFNQGPGLSADVFDGVKLIANEFSGNGRGVELSEKVRMATITSNLIVGNDFDAMKVSSGFYGSVASNTIMDNGGCTIQFFSAEQKILNKVERKVTLGKDFQAQLAYEPTNYAENNRGDDGRSNRKSSRKKNKVNGTSGLAPCGASLN